MRRKNQSKINQKSSSKCYNFLPRFYDDFYKIFDRSRSLPNLKKQPNHGRIVKKVKNVFCIRTSKMQLKSIKNIRKSNGISSRIPHNSRAPLHLSIYLTMYLPTYLSIYLFDVSIQLLNFRSMDVSTYRSLNLSICRSICLFVYASI